MNNLTWDYVVEKCERFIHYFEDAITQQPARNFELAKNSLECATGLRAAIPKLRAFPEIEGFPPLMSLLGLSWSLENNLEIHLFYSPDKQKYEIKLVREDNNILLREVDVEIDEVATDVWRLIDEFK